MDIGGELRAARRARKRTIDQIARTTKITPALLRAIENNDFDRVPGGLFTRGYLRAYAREVGLDPEALVQRYRTEVEGAVPEAPEPQDAVASHDVDMAELAPTGESSPGQIIQICVIVIVVAAYFAWLRPSKPAARPGTLVAQSAVATPPAPEPKPVATAGQSPSARPPLDVDLRADGPCWVAAAVDGSNVVARLMNAGEHERLKVGEHLALRVGDPAVFVFSIDGVPGRSLGRAGQAVSIQIDRDNYETFLQPRRQHEGATDDLRPVADAARAAVCCPHIP
jgi:hypothetical protein